MYELISKIEERAYNAAVARGKNTSHTGCAEAMAVELAEFWAAAEAGRELPDDILEVARTYYENEKDKEFADYYEKYLHNTKADEMADMIIVAATWIHDAREKAEAAGEIFIPGKCINVVLAGGAIQFVAAQITGMRDLDLLVTMVNLKLRFNELRKD